MAQEIPFALGDTAVFLWRGQATSVAWHGDFNAWSRDRRVPHAGQRVDGSDVWWLELPLPNDARVDYKIVVDGEWMLDPNNPHTVVSGFGPNSELRMPGYLFPEEVTRRPGVPGGTLTPPQRVFAASLGYEIQYRVYLPPSLDPLAADAATLYVTDGHEYAHEEMGALPVVLDNLLAAQKIRPVVAIFVDPRHPDSLSVNRREQQFLMNANYVAFFVEQLIPEIERQYPVSKSPTQRGILGTSYGGLNATYFGAMRPDVFGLVAIQSPAYGSKQEIFDLYTDSPRRPLKVFMTSGSLNDGQVLARRMANILREKDYPLLYLEVNEGHSWGAWRGQLDEMLLYFFGRPDTLR